MGAQSPPVKGCWPVSDFFGFCQVKLAMQAMSTPHSSLWTCDFPVPVKWLLSYLLASQTASSLPVSHNIHQALATNHLTL